MPRRLIPPLLRVWPLELVLLWAGGGWLIRMINPALNLFGVGTSFGVMARVPTGWWIALFADAWVLLAYGIIRQQAGARLRAVLAWAGVWAFVATLLHLGNPDAPGDTTYGALALGCALAFLRQQWTERRG